jgi:hypothetical protein
LIVATSARACVADKNFFAPPAKQLEQQPVEPVDRLGSGATEFVAAVDQHAHHHQLGIGADMNQVRSPQRDQRDGVGVDRVGLAAVTGREHPHLR